jgi:RimJ/RimL family protein N-acetyltransferase
MRTLQGYGLTLRQLQHEDIEKVRQWRNDPRVSVYMAFRGQISEEQQEVWFRSIDNEENHFFIIDLAGGPVGLCELKKIDRAAGSAEGGIFVHDEKFRNSPYCAAAVLLLNEHGFGQLGLERIYAQILDNNTRAIRFNKMLGYELLEPTDSGKSIYFLTKEAFRTASSNIRRGLEKILPANAVAPMTNSYRR